MSEYQTQFRVHKSKKNKDLSELPRVQGKEVMDRGCDQSWPDGDTFVCTHIRILLLFPSTF